MSDDPMSTLGRDRIACKLWGDEVLDAQGSFYARSSDEVVWRIGSVVRASANE